MTKLILIRGNAASGKTSLANALQRQLGENTLLLSQDKLRREMLLAHDGFDTPTIPLLKHLITFGMANCDYIILEGILKADWYAPVWDFISQQSRLQVFAYYYDIPFEETLKRHSSRSKVEEFGEEALRKWWNEKDYIKIISETSFDKTVTLQEALNYILQDITKRSGLTS
ncbi:putative kinase [Streptococcus dysgalactiae subsp. equisimilis]|uniref:kinase n=1 Tax=Streptococcus dysgalactiae TaxID=1334 RepID=UPI000DA2E2AC|nr:kinase [Streptococcus dysgalactiae]SQE85041.1 putative kinase [Streptococcus dysgalactiae subsp. equisimilis]